MTESTDRLKAFSIDGGTVERVVRLESVTIPEPNVLHVQIADSGPYYRVEMILRPSEQSRIRVVVCLPEPENWNGKFLGTGNGGFAGTIAEMALLGGVSRRYAVANTDMGTSADPDECIGKEEIYKDYGYRATHLMTEAGKTLVEWFYGKKAQYSYFFGGSTGGQQAFSEAERYPEDYDGIVCLSPALDRVRLHTFFVWNWQQIHREKDGTFTPVQAADWRDSVVKVLGRRCGSNPDDLFLAYPGRIKTNPMDDPEIRKEAEKLTEGQRRALRGIYDGPRDQVTGGRIIAHFLPGTEAESLSLADISDREKFSHEFFYLFRWIFGKDFDFMNFDFHDDFLRAEDRLGPMLNANNPDLSAFRKHGGRLLTVGGSSDAIIPYTGFLDYYRKVTALQGGLDKTREFFRFVLMPGFAHTIGGQGVQDVGIAGISATPRDAEHDALCAMEDWVERGSAPERLLGTHFERDTNGIRFGYARPAYMYPSVTACTGGDPKNPMNYQPIDDASAY